MNKDEQLKAGPSKTEDQGFNPFSYAFSMFQTPPNKEEE